MNLWEYIKYEIQKNSTTESDNSKSLISELGTYNPSDWVMDGDEEVHIDDLNFRNLLVEEYDAICNNISELEMNDNLKFFEFEDLETYTTLQYAFTVLIRHYFSWEKALTILRK